MVLTVSRKVKRKQERLQKKQNKNKRQRVDSIQQQQPEKPQKVPQSKDGMSSLKKKRRPMPAVKSGSGAFQNRFHELIAEMNDASPSSHASLNAEDRKIKALETKLGLTGTSTKKKSLAKLKNEYAKDGLGDDFADFLMGLNSISKMVKKDKHDKDDVKEEEEDDDDEEDVSDADEELDEEQEQEEDADLDAADDDMEGMDEDTHKEFLLLQQEDAEFLKGMDELPTDESESESETDLAAFESDEEEDLEQDDQLLRNTLKNQKAMHEEEEEQADEDEETRKPKKKSCRFSEEVEANASEEEEAEDVAEDEQEGEESQEEQEEDLDVDQQDENAQEEEDEDDEAKDEEVKEDIYGRPILQKAASAYVPPHLRRKQQQEPTASASTSATSGMDEASLRELSRRINGQLNRISEGNMESITLEMERIYREHVRSVVNDILYDKIMQTCCHKTQVMTPLIKVCAALVGGLYHCVGTEIGGFFIEKVVHKLHALVTASRGEHVENVGNDEDVISSKEPLNLLLFAASLYNFGVVHCTLVYDLFRSFVDHFSALELELIHQLLKHCGHQLRADDADSLKEMVASVQEKALSMQNQAQTQQQKNKQPKSKLQNSDLTKWLVKDKRPEEDQEDSVLDAQRRVRFILDLIYELKKPKQRKQQMVDSDASLRKWIGRVKSRCHNANNPLRVGLVDLLNADKNGRWWIVGGTWVGYQQQQEQHKQFQQQLAGGGNSETDLEMETDRLMKLAEKQRMNTDVRKKIFVAIMGATDCVDAYERLLKLNLKERQEREIVRVILHCCGQELKFNKYYVVLAQKICEMDQRFKFTFQLAFWDVFKQMDDVKPRKLYNLANLLAELVLSATLSLSVLKVVDFTRLSTNSLVFLRSLMEQVLQVDQEPEFLQVFERLSASKKAQLLVDGIAVFVHQHLQQFSHIKDPAKRRLLKQRVKTLKSLLDKLSSAMTKNSFLSEY